VLGLHGGDGCTLDSLLPLADLVQFGYRVVLYDQLGCGRSERPRGAKYYTEGRAVEEVEELRKALRLGPIHLFGNSYGGALALDVALRYQSSLRSLLVSSGFANLSLLVEEQRRLFSRLPKGIRETIVKYEARGDFTNPRYLAALDVWWRKHSCRLRVWPYEVHHLGETRLDYMVHVPQGLMKKRLKGWDITNRLGEIDAPCLIITGKYDAVPAKCVEPLHRGIHGSRLVVFPDGSHLQMWEDRVRFVEIVRDFLKRVSAS